MGGSSRGSAATIQLSGPPPVRSNRLRPRGCAADRPDPSGLWPRHHASTARAPLASGFALSGGAVYRRAHRDRRRCRSEEHTSELQSLAYLVCRLLLEKKKKTIRIRTARLTNDLLIQQHRGSN